MAESKNNAGEERFITSAKAINVLRKGGQTSKSKTGANKGKTDGKKQK